MRFFITVPSLAFLRTNATSESLRTSESRRSVVCAVKMNCASPDLLNRLERIMRTSSLNTIGCIEASSSSTTITPPTCSVSIIPRSLTSNSLVPSDSSLKSMTTSRPRASVWCEQRTLPPRTSSLNERPLIPISNCRRSLTSSRRRLSSPSYASTSAFHMEDIRL